MSNVFKDSQRFMVSFGQTTNGEDPEQFRLYSDLVHEEGKELSEALMELQSLTDVDHDARDQTHANKLLHATAHLTKETIDCIVVLVGLLNSMGVNGSKAWQAVYDSNMSKLEDGKPVYRADGKVLKGKDYRPPDMVKVVLESWGVA
jgi:predicted HAD superfamily Cof-like phosphohydrolase